MGIAMKNAAFMIGEAKQVGKEEALELSIPFDEIEIMKQNMKFMFEELKMEEITFRTSEESIDDLAPTAKNARDGAMPGKPTAFFY